MANKTAAVLLRTGKVNVPPARPQPVPTGKPKVPAPVPTGRQNRHFPVPTDRGYSPSVTSGWWKSTARPMPYNPQQVVLGKHIEKVYTGYPRTIVDLIHLHGQPFQIHRENPYSDAEDEGIFDSGCSRSMIGNMERLDDFQEFQGGFESKGRIVVVKVSKKLVFKISFLPLSVHVLETVSGKVLYMFADVSYPLLVKLMERILKHKLEIDKDVVGNDMTIAEQLIRFIKNQIAAAQVSHV
ncbi:hypothetical protein Tco_1523304 [Tanacetum coccineum]